MKKSNVKKMFAGISSACVLASALPVSPLFQTAAATTTYWAGDANCDDSINAEDALYIQKYCANQVTLDAESLKRANANQDDLVNVADAITVLQMISKSEFVQIEETTSDKNYIHLQNTTISTEGDNMTVEGTKVTITASGTYYVDGTLDDGQIYVNIPDETVDAETVKIFLNGVSITGLSAPAIYVENAENTSINLVEGTTNTISDGTTAYEGDYLDNAVIEAKDDVTIKGDGTLEINTANQYAIECNNDLKFNGGTINITTSAADAVRGKSSVTVKAGTINIDSAGDGIKSTKGNVAIEGGTIGIKASNDAIQAETTIDISAGVVTASGDRGLTSITATNITGGTVVATATDNQAELVNATQGTMILNCIDDASNTDGCWKKANSIVVSSTLTASPLKKFKYVLISDSSITNGTTYSLTNGSTSSAITHTNDTSSSFVMSGVTTTFDTVNLSGSGSITPVDGEYTITLSGSVVSTNAPESVATVSNGICTIIQPGVFAVSGEMSEGQIVVNVDKTTYPEGVVELDLMGVNLTNTTDSPIYVAAIGDECQIVAKSGYTNTISDGTSYTNADAGVGAIYACDDLKIKGTGSLTVNGNCEDAIVCKNDLKLYNGSITVNAVDDAIRGKDSVTIGNSSDTDFSALSISVNSTSGDGIKSTETDDTTKGTITINGGTINANVFSDGIQGEQNVVINDGTINIYTYQGSTYSGTGSSSGNQPGGMQDGNNNKTENSAKGIKAVGLYDEAGTTWQSAGNITINGGTITVDSSDDSLHCGGDMTILGGKLTLATADDGIHSDHSLIIGTSGDLDLYSPYVEITKSYEGVEGVDITLNNGTVLVTSSDDGYNAAGGTDSSGTTSPGGWNPGQMGSGSQTLVINGGYTYVNAAGDGLDSNGTLTINGGYVFVSQTGGGNSPIDCDTTWSNNGGVVIAGGSNDMFSESIPASYTAVSRNCSISAGTVVSVTDSSGNVLGSMTFANSAAAIVLCATNGASAYTGGTISGSTSLPSSSTNNNMKAGYGGTISGGTQLSSSSGGQTNPWG